MDDGETVAAIAAGDPAGLAAAYDAYAAPLYGYCRWMLRDPSYAAEALRDTFAAAAKPGTVREASQLRAWLYTTAREECHRRLRTAEPGFDETADLDEAAGGDGPDGAAGSGRPADGGQRAEVRRLIRETLAELKQDEHEVIELSIRHDLDETELATVLEISWSRAHALASRAREHLEKALGALLVARTRRQSCPELGALLADWDGHLTVQTGKLTAQHIEHCETCAAHNHGTLRPEVLSGLLPLATLPPGLREPVLRQAGTRARRPLGRPDLRRAAAFLSWGSIRANPGTATAVAAVAVWVVAAMSATLITVGGLHVVRALAVQRHSVTATTPAPATSSSSQAPPRASPSRSPSPTPAIQPAPYLRPTAGPTPSASPSKSAKPSPSKSASPSASPSASASASPSPSPTPTHSVPPRPTPTPT